MLTADRAEHLLESCSSNPAWAPGVGMDGDGHSWVCLLPTFSHQLFPRGLEPHADWHD